MNRFHYQIISIILVFLSAFPGILAQSTKVMGVVADENGEPLSFVNVAFQRSTVGTITDIDGKYFIRTLQPTDTLVASSLGYGREKRAVEAGREQTINFQLFPVSHNIEEVTVKPGENPAFAILRNIQDRKKQNDPDRFGSYQYTSYNKLRLDLNNIEEKFREYQ